jgi:hypothetical protein
MRITGPRKGHRGDKAKKALVLVVLVLVFVHFKQELRLGVEQTLPVLGQTANIFLSAAPHGLCYNCPKAPL